MAIIPEFPAIRRVFLLAGFVALFFLLGLLKRALA